MILSYLFEHTPTCTGFDDFDHKPMVTTNEINSGSIIGEMGTKAPQGNLMVAVSGFFALNIFAVRQNLDYLLLLDRGTKVHHFWQETKRIIENTDDHSQACESLMNMIERNQEYYYSGHSQYSPEFIKNIIIQDLAREVLNGTSWLSTQSKYWRIKTLFHLNRIEFKQVDLCNPTPLKWITTAINISGLSVDIIYLSNVQEYAAKEKKLTLFYKSLKPLIAPATWIIDAHEGPDNFLLQRIFQKGTRELRHCLKAGAPVAHPTDLPIKPLL